jgi:uncharacterized repeat protein (TIGR03803 family)
MKKMCIKRSFVVSVLVVGLELVLSGQLPAQTFKTLHSFSGTDGRGPNGRLVLSGNTLYGTTYGNGSPDNGTVFAINTDGTGFRTLYRFSRGIDGGGPAAGLISSGNILYGTTIHGGTSDYGTVFAINNDGTGFTSLYSFSGGSDGKEPYSALLLESNVLYGTTHLGGDYGWGTVFGVNTDGSGSIALYSFTGGSDGRIPFSQLVLPNNALIGTAPAGGDSGKGTVFAVGLDGTSFTTLYSFSATPTQGPSTNSDGSLPYAGLVLSGNILYGAAESGGNGGGGTVFKVNTDGTSFTVLHSFTATSNGTNSDGGLPGSIGGDLTLSGGTLYGPALLGGSSGKGTVFTINTDGTGFTTLHSFSGGAGGSGPSGGLLLSGNMLYGTSGGGSFGLGTIFSISLPSNQPQLTIASSGQNVLLSWPTNFTDFTLQSTPSLASPVWTTNLPPPVVVSGQNTVTNPISGTQQFFRLAH